jgi:Flp pilus assembly protein TadD
VRLRQTLLTAWPAAAIAAAAVAAYLPALGAGFVFDDVPLLLRGGQVQGPLSAIWLGRGGPDYWPFTMTTFWVEWRLWGEAAAGYHATNVAMHAGAAILLWRLLRALQVPGAPVAGLVFAVHPVAVESVAWIAERKNTLSAVLFLGAALAWNRFDLERRVRPLALATLLFAAALLAKVSVAPLPLVLLGVCAVRRGRLERRDLLGVVPLLALALVAGLVTLWFQRHVATGYGWSPDRDLLDRVGRAARALAFYVRTAYLPAGLSFVYPEWPPTVASFLPAVAVSAVGLVLWAARGSWGRAPLLALGYQALMLLPVLGLVEIAWFRIGPVSNHLQYLALMAPAALAGLALARLASRRRVLGSTAAAMLAAGLGVATASRARAFEDELTLWQAAVRGSPESTVARRELAIALAERGRGQEALAELEAMATVARDPAGRHHARALWLLASGRAAEAAREAEQAVRLSPDPAFRRDLGVALVKAGRWEDAVAALEPLVRAEPQAADPRYWLGLALAGAGRLPEATQALREACRLAPGDPEMQEALAAVLERSSEAPPR